MNSKFSPDDPKLTAYALGELDPAEAAAVEARLQSDPLAQQLVEEIRAMSNQLEAALAAEDGESAAAELETVAAAPEPQVVHLPYARRKRGWAQVLGFPQSYFLISGAAAAIFVGMVLVGTPHVERNDRVALQLANEQRARAIAEARYEAFRQQVLREQRAANEAAAAIAGSRAAAVFRTPNPEPGVQFVVPSFTPSLPRPEPIGIVDPRHVIAGVDAADQAAFAADLPVDSGNEEGGDELVRMDPLLVEDFAMNDFGRDDLLYRMSMPNVIDWARSGIAPDDPSGFRREYINLRRHGDGS